VNLGPEVKIASSAKRTRRPQQMLYYLSPFAILSLLYSPSLSVDPSDCRYLPFVCFFVSRRKLTCPASSVGSGLTTQSSEGGSGLGVGEAVLIAVGVAALPFIIWTAIHPCFKNRRSDADPADGNGEVVQNAVASEGAHTPPIPENTASMAIAAVPDGPSHEPTTSIAGEAVQNVLVPDYVTTVEVQNVPGSDTQTTHPTPSSPIS
jgi:hypothetical protein